MPENFNDILKAATAVTRLHNDSIPNDSLKAVVAASKIYMDIYLSSYYRDAVDLAKYQSQWRIYLSDYLKTLQNLKTQAVVSLQIHREFTESYDALLQSMTAHPTQFGILPPVVATLPSVEFYNANRVLEVFSDEDIAPELQVKYQNIDEEIALDTEDSLEILLRELDPGLIRMWRGVSDALSSESEDRVRHFSVSARELFTHIIHKLAPDDEVQEWTDNPNHFDKNRPTRRARVLYICRDFDYSQFSNFVDKDTTASIALSDLFQSGVHAQETDLTPGQMSALKMRIESTLRFLLETARVMRA